MQPQSSFFAVFKFVFHNSPFYPRRWKAKGFVHMYEFVYVQAYCFLCLLTIYETYWVIMIFVFINGVSFSTLLIFLYVISTDNISYSLDGGNLILLKFIF